MSALTRVVDDGRAVSRAETLEFLCPVLPGSEKNSPKQFFAESPITLRAGVTLPKLHHIVSALAGVMKSPGRAGPTCCRVAAKKQTRTLMAEAPSALELGRSRTVAKVYDVFLASTGVVSAAAWAVALGGVRPEEQSMTFVAKPPSSLVSHCIDLSRLEFGFPGHHLEF
jgi:hypothetical protein